MRQISAVEERTFSHARSQERSPYALRGSSSGETPERIGARFLRESFGQLVHPGIGTLKRQAPSRA